MMDLKEFHYLMMFLSVECPWPWVCMIYRSKCSQSLSIFSLVGSSTLPFHFIAKLMYYGICLPNVTNVNIFLLNFRDKSLEDGGNE